jgi:hypothetical protein
MHEWRRFVGEVVNRLTRVYNEVKRASSAPAETGCGIVTGGPRLMRRA